MGKVHQLMEWAIQNDMVTGDIVISSGMRSPAKAHKLGTSYEIQNMDQRGNVTPESLKALPEGKDADGTLWKDDLGEAFLEWICDDSDPEAEWLETELKASRLRHVANVPMLVAT
jgi:hypothetical protein